MKVKADPRLSASLIFFSQAASLAIMLIGGLVLLGWTFDIAALKSILPGLASMKANTALSFVMAGTTLWLLQGEPSLLKRRLALAGAIFVTVLALLTLSQDLFGWNLGLDQFLFRDTPAAGSTVPPGRMSLATAFNFSLIGGALLLLDVKRGREGWLAQILLLLAGMVALLALVGYVYGIQSLYRLGPFSSMALHTALTFFVLSLAILTARLERGIIAAIIADTASGLMLRRLLPAALVLPIVLGWIRLQGQRAGLFDTEVGLAIFALSNIAVFTGLIWWTARLLQRTDAGRKQAEEQFRLVVEGSPNAMILVSTAGQIHLVNAQTEALFGYTRAELLGQPVEMLVPPQFRAYHDRYRDTFFAAPAARPMGAGRDLFGLRKDGSQAPIEIGLNPITTSAGSFVLASIIDITERRQAEAALGVERRLLRTLIDALPDIIFTRDTGDRYVMGNLALLETIGVTREEELAGKTVFDLYPCELAEGYYADDLQALGGQPVLNREEVSVDAAGNQGWYLTTKMPLHNHTGEIIGLVGISRNITERKRIEEVLRQSEQKFSILFQKAAFAAVLSRPPDGVIVDVNEAFERAFGYTKQEVTGKTSQELGINPDAEDRARIIAVLQTQGSVRDIELMLRTKFGVARVFLVNIDLVDIGGQKYILQTAQDITERKQGEQARTHLAAIVESSSDAIIGKDLQGNVLSWNSGAERIFGYSADEIIGQPITRLIPPDHLGEEEQILSRLKQGERVHNFETLRLGKKGQLIDVSVTISPIVNALGEVVGASKVAHDITERKRAEEALRQSEEQFRQVVEASLNAIFLVNPAGQISLVNTQAEKLFGYTRQEMLGQPVELLVPPQFHAEHRGYRDVFHKTLTTRAIAGRELLGMRKDGSQVPIEIGLNPITTAEGSFVLASIIDITERKRAEEVLKKSEASLAKAQQVAHLGSWELDLVNLDEVDSNNLRWSDEVYRIFGYNPGEIEPSNELFFGAVPADEVPLIQQGVAQAIAEKKTFSMDHRVVRPDGTERIVHEYADVICDELTGRPLRLFGIIQDITERKQAEEALRESEERTRLIVESALDAVVTINTDSTLTGWNTQAEAIFGWSRQEALGQSIDIILPPQYREAHHRGLKHFLATGEGPVLNQRIEISAQHRDGHEFPVELAISAVRLGNSFIFSAFIRDITKRNQAEAALRQSEERFAKAFRASPAALSITRPTDGCFVDINESFQSLLGYSREELIGHRSTELNMFTNPDERAELVRRLREQGSVRNCEMTLRAKSGELHSVLFSTEMLELDGEAHALAILFDITERKRAEEGLRQTMVELARSNAELEQFAFVASHDLQEPLRAVASTIQLLQKRYTGRLDDRADEFIRHAVEGATRMQTLIHDLLAFSRVGTQGQPVQPTDSTAALTRAQANLAVVIRESGAVISHDSLPTVKADAGQLVQLFQNLIGNAIKFRSDKAPAIHIGAEQQKGDWLFTVRDNGIGIEAQYFERIFVVFQRLHTRREYQGTGIGLAICKKIVDRHGGRIWVESEAGQGSSFYFTLPAARRETDDP